MIANCILVGIAFLTPVLTADFTDVFNIENSGIYIYAIYFVLTVAAFLCMTYFIFLKFRKNSNELIFTFKHFVKECLAVKDFD